jgi:hypothetical protein
MSMPIKSQVFDNCDPIVAAGETVQIKVSQTLERGGSNILETTAAKPVQLKIDGPQFKLDPSDISGVYPAPNSEESPDEYLPHVALKRRTLPWERRGPGPKPTLPWLFLLLLDEDEFGGVQATTVAQIKNRDLKTYEQFVKPIASGGLGLADGHQLNVVYVRKTLLSDILPPPDELELLSHVKRTWKDGAIDDTAIVVANRLPDASDDPPKLHTALLVSLERRDDLYVVVATSGEAPPIVPQPTTPVRAAAPAITSGRMTAAMAAVAAASALVQSKALIVLHHWSFTPSKGGDFEEVMKLIRYRPNGGVLRFGNLPRKVPQGGTVPLSGGFAGALNKSGYFLDPLPHEQPANAVYRGPLRPFAPASRSKGFAVRAAPEEFTDADPGLELDYSHAAAFEIGRLLALADGGILEDLRNIGPRSDKLKEVVAVDKVPDALRKKDWVVNPEWAQERWGPTDKSLVKTALPMNGDYTGIRDQVKAWGNAVVQELAGAPVAVEGPVTDLDINAATAEALSKKFADVVTAAKS